MENMTWHRRPLGDVVALVVGCLFPLGFAPFEWRSVSWLSLLVLFIVWQGVSVKRAFLRGWLWGLGAFLVGISWVYNSMHDFGGSPVLAAAVFTLCFAAFLALYPALTGGIWQRYLSDKPFWFSALGLGLMWPVSEWLRAWVLTGFPWLMSGFTLLDTPFAGFMPLIGSLGASVIAATCVGLLSIAIYQGSQEKIITTALVIVVALLLSSSLNQIEWESKGDTRTLDVALVQGNVPQEVKLRSEYLNVSLQAYYELSKPHFDADLIIWPETAMPTYRYAVEGFLNRVAAETEKENATVFTGIFFRAENGQDYYNAMLELGGEWQVYKKHQLVPFGEYMPVRWLMKLFSSFVDIPQSDMASSEKIDKPLSLAGASVATSICYEMAYPDVLRSQLGEADIMVNTSNDAWFGDSFAAHQHLEMARVRATEFAKPIARATNNGVTAFVDARGNIVSQIDQFKPLVLREKISLNSGQTIFYYVGQFWVGVVMVLILVVILFASKFSTPLVKVKRK